MLFIYPASPASKAMTVLLSTMLLTLGGCSAAPSPTPATVATVEFTEFYADANITGEVAATTVVGKRVGDGNDVGGDAGAVLPLQLRLRNRGDRPLALTESTRCTVLRWSIADAQGDTVQAMPNHRCAQQLATRTLPPAQTITRAYQIPLPVRSPGRYTVRFSFWGYPGEHAFEMR